MQDAQGFVLWIAGAPGANCATFALEVLARLEQGHLRGKLLAPPAVASSGETDAEAIETFSRLCQAQASEGVISIFTDDLFSRALREEARRWLPPTVHVLVRASRDGSRLAVSDERDGHEARGLSKFEEPAAPDMIFQTGVEPLTQGVNRLLSLLESRGLIPPSDLDVQRDEQILTERLKELGYL